MKIRQVIIAIIFSIAFFSCETEFIPEGIPFEEQIVVEGYIEAGEQATPPYVILTRNQAFFSEFNSNDFENLFVHDAEITVTDGEQTVDLTEICLSELDPSQQALLSEFLGLEPDSVGIDICVYTDLSFSMQGQIGKRYDLFVDVEETTITASTTIPSHVPLDSLVFSPIPDPDNDTLQTLSAFLSDPPGIPNFYRYFSKVNNEAMLPGLQSVGDDALIDGEAFEFPLPRAQSRTEEFDPDTYGFFTEGDTVTIKWCNIDEEHFNFWNTLEFNAANQGPFSSYTVIDSNIEGGLGIWGGYSHSFYTIIVPED